MSAINKMQSETAYFAPCAAAWRSQSNDVVWRSAGAATWRTGRNIRVVFDSGLFLPLCGNMTSLTEPEVQNKSQCRQRRTEPRPQSATRVLRAIVPDWCLPIGIHPVHIKQDSLTIQPQLW